MTGDGGSTSRVGSGSSTKSLASEQVWPEREEADDTGYDKQKGKSTEEEPSLRDARGCKTVNRFNNHRFHYVIPLAAWDRNGWCVFHPRGHEGWRKWSRRTQGGPNRSKGRWLWDNGGMSRWLHCLLKGMCECSDGGKAGLGLFCQS